MEGNKRVNCLPKEAENNEKKEISEKHCTYEDTLRCTLRLRKNNHSYGEELKPTQRNKT